MRSEAKAGGRGQKRADAGGHGRTRAWAEEFGCGRRQICLDASGREWIDSDDLGRLGHGSRWMLMEMDGFGN